MHITRLELENVLSFGPGQTLELAPLNICIGANGSGKSNLIEALNLLRHCATDLSKPFIESGGISDWIFRNAPNGKKEMNLTIELKNDFIWGEDLIHHIVFSSYQSTYKIVSEIVKPNWAKTESEFFCKLQNGKPTYQVFNRTTKGFEKIEDVDLENIKFNQSFLSSTYNGVTLHSLKNYYQSMHLYREWGIGKNSAPRQPARTDSVDDFLLEDFSNLALVLNELGEVPAREKQFIEYLNRINASFSVFGVRIIQNFALLYLKEHAFASGTIPSTRLSGGTLRMLCLLAILLHPTPPPLICIEEPEVGLHPDLMPTIAELLKDASTRTQLIVTTHSDILVDCFSDTPEAVLVFDKNPEDGISQVKRLEKAELGVWLEQYGLGNMWVSGHIGGKRW